MNVSVTASRADIEVAAELLKLLEPWEKLLNASDSYSRGSLAISIDGNPGKASVCLGIDPDGLHATNRDHVTTTVDKKIRAVAASHAKQIAITAVEIIKSHMPIPLDK